MRKQKSWVQSVLIQGSRIKLMCLRRCFVGARLELFLRSFLCALVARCLFLRISCKGVGSILIFSSIIFSVPVFSAKWFQQAHATVDQNLPVSEAPAEGALAEPSGLGVDSETAKQPKDQKSSHDDGSSQTESLPFEEMTGVEARFEIKKVRLESESYQTRLQISSTGGLSAIRTQVFSNPGRLVIEIPQSKVGMKIDPKTLTDEVVIPRVRHAQHPEFLRLVVDTVVAKLPAFQIQKTDQNLVVTFQKTPDLVVEAKSRAPIFAKLQQNDRASLLLVGSDDEGGILSSAILDQKDEKSHKTLRQTLASDKNSGGVRVSEKGGSGNRIILLLDEGKEYQVFIQDSGAPIHIQRVKADQLQKMTP